MYGLIQKIYDCQRVSRPVFKSKVRLMAEKNHRLCVSCRQTRHRDQLWRIVRTYPHRQIVIDDGMGRSAYLCQQATCLQAAQKKDRLSRSLRAKVPAEIYQILEDRLHNDS